MQVQDYMRQKRERTGTNLNIDWTVDWIKDLNISAEMLLKEKIPSLTLHTRLRPQYERQSKRSCPTELFSQPSKM